MNRVSHNLGKRDGRLPETLSGIKMEGNEAGAICSSLRKPSANEFCVADLHWFPRSVSRENKCTAALRFSEIILKVSFTFTVPCNYNLNVFFFFTGELGTRWATVWCLFAFKFRFREYEAKRVFDGVSSVVKAFDITKFETYLSNISQLETTSNVYSSFWLAERFAKRQQENLLRRFAAKEFVLHLLWAFSNVTWKGLYCLFC